MINLFVSFLFCLIWVQPIDANPIQDQVPPSSIEEMLNEFVNEIIYEEEISPLNPDITHTCAILIGHLGLRNVFHMLNNLEDLDSMDAAYIKFSQELRTTDDEMRRILSEGVYNVLWWMRWKNRCGVCLMGSRIGALSTLAGFYALYE